MVFISLASQTLSSLIVSNICCAIQHSNAERYQPFSPPFRSLLVVCHMLFVNWDSVLMAILWSDTQTE
jgi:hypothetical protein